MEQIRETRARRIDSIVAIGVVHRMATRTVSNTFIVERKKPTAADKP